MTPGTARSADRDPAASRPHMPGYGIAPAGDGDGLLPWSWAVHRLEGPSGTGWRPPGRTAPPPRRRLGPLGRRRLPLSTGGGSRKARNLADDPRCAVTPEHADESVVVQGVASRVTDPAELSALLAAYRDKYGSGFPDPLQNPVVTVHPRVVFGVIEREEQFTTTATRWVFPS